MYTYIMERTQIYLTSEQSAALDRAAKASGRSRSELIRDAIDRLYLDQQSREERIRAFLESAGAWDNREFTGEEYVESLRTGARLKRLYPDDEASSG
jgi:predicted transcriptional regulator